MTSRKILLNQLDDILMTSPLSESPSPQDSTLDSYFDDDDELSRDSLFMRNNSTKSNCTYSSIDTFTSLDTAGKAVNNDFDFSEGFVGVKKVQITQTSEQNKLEYSSTYSSKNDNQLDVRIEKLKVKNKKRHDSLFNGIDGIFTEIDDLIIEGDSHIENAEPTVENKTECKKIEPKLEELQRINKKEEDANYISSAFFKGSPYSSSPPTRINMPRNNTQLHRQLTEQASNLSDILDCFLDMTCQESAQIAQNSLTYFEDIQASVAHNSTIIPNFHLQFNKYKKRYNPSERYTSTYTRKITRVEDNT